MILNIEKTTEEINSRFELAKLWANVNTDK